MKIIKGTTRIVFVFPKVVIKIPRIQLKIALGIASFIGWKRLHKYVFKKHSWTSINSVTHYIYGGILANWNEYFFYLKNKNIQILMPVHFSFFGLINIQSTGDPLSMESNDFSHKINILTNWEASGSHTFRNIQNFCQVDNKLRIVDYGDPRMFDVMGKYGEKMHREFRFSNLAGE